MRTKTTRSPLHSAARSDIAAMRALITARLRWEAKLGTPEQQLHADEPIAALTRLSFGTVERIRDRSRGRWQRMPHFDQSFATYKDQHLREYDRAAWEQQRLRLEVEKLRGDVADMKKVLG